MKQRYNISNSRYMTDYGKYEDPNKSPKHTPEYSVNGYVKTNKRTV